MQQWLGPGNEVRVYSLPAAVTPPHEPGVPDEPPAHLHEVPVPDVLPEAARLHRPIAVDRLFLQEMQQFI